QLAQLADQTFALIVRQRHSGLHQNANLVGTLLDQGAVGGEDWPQQVQPLVIVQDEEEVQEQRRHLPLERLLERDFSTASTHQSAEEEVADGLIRGGDPVEHVV